MSDQTVARTILAQIKAADRWALGAWGAKDFVSTENSIRFKVNCPKLKNGWVKIELDYATDTYTLTFQKFQLRKGEIKYSVNETLEGVYCDMLVEVIDRRVG